MSSTETERSIEITYDIDARFEEIVADIETTITPEEKKLLERMPVMKPTGTSDQGYRYD